MSARTWTLTLGLQNVVHEVLTPLDKELDRHRAVGGRVHAHVERLLVGPGLVYQSLLVHIGDLWEDHLLTQLSLARRLLGIVASSARLDHHGRLDGASTATAHAVSMGVDRHQRAVALLDGVRRVLVHVILAVRWPRLELGELFGQDRLVRQPLQLAVCSDTRGGASAVSATRATVCIAAAHKPEQGAHRRMRPNQASRSASVAFSARFVSSPEFL